MNKEVKNEFSKKSKLNGVYLSPRKRKSLASVLIFVKEAKPNQKASR